MREEAQIPGCARDHGVSRLYVPDAPATLKKRDPTADLEDISKHTSR
jgi:hypothetical protein